MNNLAEKLIEEGWPTALVGSLQMQEQEHMQCMELLFPIPGDILTRFATGLDGNRPSRTLHRKFTELEKSVRKSLTGPLAKNYSGPLSLVRPMLFNGAVCIPRAPELDDKVKEIILEVSRNLVGSANLEKSVRRFLALMSAGGSGGALFNATNEDIQPFVEAAVFAMQKERYMLLAQSRLNEAKDKLTNNETYATLGGDVRGIDFERGCVVPLSSKRVRSVEGVLSDMAED